MTQHHVREAAGRFAKCPKCDGQPRHIEHFGRTLAETMANNFLQGADPRDPLASPLFADLSGLSPVQVEVSGRDGIRDDALRLAVALAEAGVEVTVDDCEGAIHGYHMFAPETPEAKAGTTRLASFLNERLAS